MLFPDRHTVSRIVLTVRRSYLGGLSGFNRHDKIIFTSNAANCTFVCCNLLAQSASFAVALSYDALSAPLMNFASERFNVHEPRPRPRTRARLLLINTFVSEPVFQRASRPLLPLAFRIFSKLCVIRTGLTEILRNLRSIFQKFCAFRITQICVAWREGWRVDRSSVGNTRYVYLRSILCDTIQSGRARNLYPNVRRSILSSPRSALLSLVCRASHSCLASSSSSSSSPRHSPPRRAVFLRCPTLRVASRARRLDRRLVQ